MKIKHEEYSIYVRAPYSRQPCLYGLGVYPQTCENDGDFCLSIRDDRDNVITQYANVCAPHMLMAIIAQLME